MPYSGRSSLVLAGLIGGVLGFAAGGLAAAEWDPTVTTAARVVCLSAGVVVAVILADWLRTRQERKWLASMTFEELQELLVPTVAADTAAMLDSVEAARHWEPSVGPIDVHDPIDLKALSDRFADLIHGASPELAAALADYFQRSDDLQEAIDVASGYVVLEDVAPRAPDPRQAAVDLTVAIYRLREEVGLPAQDPD
jgi:hypothetical protein